MLATVPYSYISEIFGFSTNGSICVTVNIGYCLRYASRTAFRLFSLPTFTLMITFGNSILSRIGRVGRTSLSLHSKSFSSSCALIGITSAFKSSGKLNIFLAIDDNMTSSILPFCRCLILNMVFVGFQPFTLYMQYLCQGILCNSASYFLFRLHDNKINYM